MKKFIVLAMALVMSGSLAGMSRAYEHKPKTQKIAGWFSDEKCGAKGADASHAACAKTCVEGGSPIVLITDKDHSILKVDNQDAAKEHVGHHVTVTGTVADGSVHVNKIAMQKQPKAKKQKGEHAAG